MIVKESIEAALKEYYNLGPAAKALGIGYSTLRKYIKEYGIIHNSRKSRYGAKDKSLVIKDARKRKKMPKTWE